MARKNVTIPLDLDNPRHKALWDWLESLSIPKATVCRNAVFSYQDVMQKKLGRDEDTILADGLSRSNEGFAEIDIEGEFWLMRKSTMAQLEKHNTNLCFAKL